MIVADALRLVSATAAVNKTQALFCSLCKRDVAADRHAGRGWRLT